MQLNLEGRWFNSWSAHWDFLFTLFFQPYDGLAVDRVSNRNEYRSISCAVKAADGKTDNLPLSYACHLEILLASTSWSPKGLSRSEVRQLYLLRTMELYPIYYSWDVFCKWI